MAAASKDVIVASGQERLEVPDAGACRQAVWSDASGTGMQWATIRPASNRRPCERGELPAPREARQTYAGVHLTTKS